jgi:hypothetical protein
MKTSTQVQAATDKRNKARNKAARAARQEAAGATSATMNASRKVKGGSSGGDNDADMSVPDKKRAKVQPVSDSEKKQTQKQKSKVTHTDVDTHDAEVVLPVKKRVKKAKHVPDSNSDSDVPAVVTRSKGKASPSMAELEAAIHRDADKLLESFTCVTPDAREPSGM